MTDGADPRVVHWSRGKERACHRCATPMPAILFALAVVDGPPHGMWWTVTGQVSYSGPQDVARDRVKPLCDLSDMRALELQQQMAAWRAEHPPRTRRKRPRRRPKDTAGAT